MRVSASVVLAVCVVAAIGAVALGAGPAVGQTGDADPDTENASQTIEIQLEEDGDANVSVRNRFAIETREDRRAFERLADGFENGDTNGELSVEVFERVAADAENETDREMTVTNVERETEATNSTGTVELRFDWEGFARAEDGRLEVADVFGADGGTWLPSLSADQRLVIDAPDGYAVYTVHPETAVSGGEIAWTGPIAFDSDQPEVVFISGGSSAGSSWFFAGLGVGLVAVIAALVYVLSRRFDAPVVPSPASDDRGWATVLTPGSKPSEEPPTTRSEPEFEDGTDPEGGPVAGVDEELLSDEERVLMLLEVNDGRMKQANIVSETDWSNAKVSQLLSAMEDDGMIEKLRIGRENLITLCEE
ncbi:helix-turn-helix transcriptional regulator [Halalkalicoccus subterraneus]|uniref:helix-turn-helix transcriptional regulator n=1 Tax=Halalkalicoccus subterraneus TaxID=2675002 RepID=UPI000EFD13BD|nr:hypothetical protein [Halalkalicoccus subterraneus]